MPSGVLPGTAQPIRIGDHRGERECRKLSG